MKTPSSKKGLPPEIKHLLEAEPAADAARLREVWDLADAPDSPDFPSESALSGILEQLEASIDEEPAEKRVRQLAGPREPVRRTAWFVRLRWMAAAAVILLGAVVYWLKPVEVTVSPGETTVVLLEDGTRVELNSGARLRHARSFGAIRSVYLEGEAFFDVSKESRPFVVETFNAGVTVLGTSFNLKAWSRDVAPATQVALQEGSVRLASNNTSFDPVIMEPGQTAQVSSNGIELNPADTVIASRAAAWRRGDFFFSEEWVGSILDEVARRFDTTVRVEDETIRRKRMKLNLEKPGSAEAVIGEICAGLGLRYREIAGGYELFDPQ